VNLNFQQEAMSILGKTPQQKATGFKQFVNTVIHKTKSSNKKIDRHTNRLLSTNITVITTQVVEAITKAANKQLHRS
jgi:flagellar hook-basal body complex protein FliE